MRTTGSSKTEIVYAVKQVEMGIPVRRPDSSNVPVRVLSGLRSRMSVEKASPRLVPLARRSWNLILAVQTGDPAATGDPQCIARVYSIRTPHA